MADSNLQTESDAATSKLALELEVLEARVRKMELLLRGAESVLNAIRYDCELVYAPTVSDNAKSHRRAYDMIEFLGEQLTEWRSSQEELDFAADDIWALADKAKQGQLRRYGKPILEPVD